MNEITKGRSPFYPGQPVPLEFFTGRAAEIQRILRSIKQVELGKPQALFITGEYGIGKSSLAGFIRNFAEAQHHLFGIHVFLGGAATLDEVASKTVESVLRTQAYEPSITEKARNFLAKYVGKQELFGISLDLEKLRADAPQISHGFLPFLGELLRKLREDGITGLMLILDEINGISTNPQFAHFIKTLVDENALSRSPLPLLLVLCGVEERRREMIRNHQPVERIFDIIEISPMNQEEMREFFHKSFDAVGVKVKVDAMWSLCHYSAGFPKIMHIIGDNVFWLDQDNVIDDDDAFGGITRSAGEVGEKFVDQQVYKALHSKDYHSILEKLAGAGVDMTFLKADIESKLSETEKKKLNNFLQRMKKLKVLRSGEIDGEYVFTNRLVRVYLYLNSIKPKQVT